MTEALYESGLIRFADGREPSPEGRSIEFCLTDQGRALAQASPSRAKNKARRPEGAHLTRQGNRRRIARVGRSLQDLVAFLGDLQAAGVDLYLDRQGIDTTPPGGKALFQMMGVFAEFERAMIRERINAGLTRARKEGKRLGRPPGASKKRQAKQSQVQKLHKQGHSVRQIARQVGIATGTVQTYLKSA